MDKLNKKGFTLIELLAVITIMGILVGVSVPTISRTIENSRKRIFVDTAKKYAQAAKNMWMADGFQCGSYSSAAVPAGPYYIRVNTEDPNLPQLLESGGKSPWDGRELLGVILVIVYIRDNTRKVTVYPILVDGEHGINVNPDGSIFGIAHSSEKLALEHVVMKGSKKSSFFYTNGNWRNFTFTADYNDDGDKIDIVDGIKEDAGRIILCNER